MPRWEKQELLSIIPVQLALLHQADIHKIAHRDCMVFLEFYEAYNFLWCAPIHICSSTFYVKALYLMERCTGTLMNTYHNSCCWQQWYRTLFFCTTKLLVHKVIKLQLIWRVFIAMIIEMLEAIYAVCIDIREK